ncbi:MAG: hypothetical protein ACE37J_00635 [Pikeienuella sp.]|uniref:hypothetical protein n=1 Tax=Pikeienuella sp. TaxID=2831957 RepID=UPI00391DDB6B
MLSYPYEIEIVDDQLIEIVYPDFPLISGFGPGAKRLLPHMERRLFGLVDAYISAGLVLPRPGRGLRRSALPEALALRARTYWNLEAAGTPRPILASVMGEGVSGLARAASARRGDEADAETRRAAAIALALRAAAGAQDGDIAPAPVPEPARLFA